MQYETLGEWCKWLEKNFSNEIMIPTLPIIIRLDGVNFSKWTKGLVKPFDEDFHKTMVATTKFLVHETNALIGYTQSDEITLILFSDSRKSQVYHDGKKQKILSKLSSKVANNFNHNRENILENHHKIADFDARIYQTPTKQDAVAQLLWRELDATKNSISMLAQSLFPHNQLQNLDGNKMQHKMMLEKDVNWNDLDVWKKRGTYIRRTVTSETLTVEDIENLPPKHHARQNPLLEVTRSVVEQIDMPIFSRVENKVDVIFNNAKPILK